ncbi:unnamed protein product [Lampetra planeri]
MRAQKFLRSLGTLALVYNVSATQQGKPRHRPTWIYVAVSQAGQGFRNADTATLLRVGLSSVLAHSLAKLSDDGTDRSSPATEREGRSLRSPPPQKSAHNSRGARK